MKSKLVAALLPLIERGRTDIRAVKKPKGYAPERKPLDAEALAHHVNGGPYYGIFLIKPGESVCRMAVLDLDDHDGALLWDDLVTVALKLIETAEALGLKAHAWRSRGGKGIHLIFAWATPQDARSVRARLREVLAASNLTDGAGGVAAKQVEVFPKQDRVAVGKVGNLVAVPGAGLSEPLDPIFLIPEGKEAIAGYVWIDSADVPVVAPAPVKSHTGSTGVDLSTVASALAAIPNDESVDYEKWFRIVAGVHAVDSGEDGHEIAEAWSEKSPRHSRGWFEHTWDHLDASRDNGAGVGTIFHHARANGWVDPERVAALAELDAVDIAAAVAIVDALTVNNTPSSAITSAMAAFPLFMVNRFGVALPNLSNVVQALESPTTSGGIAIGYDAFRDDVMIAHRPGAWRTITDVDLIRLRKRFEEMQGGIPGIGREIMRDAIAEVADRNAFDSAKLWLGGLKWDGVPRVETFFATYYGAIDTAYCRAVSRYFLTAAAGRIQVPGIKADMVPILVGGQGVGKTEGLRELAPGPDFYVEISLADKDSDLSRMLRGKLIVELGELKGLGSKDSEHTKSFLTRRHESWVPKFKEYSTTYPRRCVIAGTTNADEFLQDDTGNRRFLPVRVGIMHRVDRDAIIRDRDQLWAEAREMFDFDLATGGPGVDWTEAEKLAVLEHDEFTVTDAWTEDVIRWLGERENPDEPFTGVDAIKGSVAISAGQIHHGHKKRIAAILKRLGYVDGRRYVNGTRVRAWSKGRDPSNSNDGTV